MARTIIKLVTPINCCLLSIIGFGLNASTSYAVNLRITPSIPQEIPKNPADKVEFQVHVFDFKPGEIVSGYNFAIGFDGAELANPLGGQQLQFYEEGKKIANSETLARLTFDVISPIKDGKPDVWFTIFTSQNPKYHIFTGIDIKLDSGATHGREFIAIKGADVVPAPESSSIIGFLALGTLGAASTLNRKRKLSQSTDKKTEKVS